MKEEFEEQLLLWSKAILIYCKKTCTTTTAIQTLVKDVDAECELFFDTNVSSSGCMQMFSVKRLGFAIQIQNTVWFILMYAFYQMLMCQKVVNRAKGL